MLRPLNLTEVERLALAEVLTRVLEQNYSQDPATRAGVVHIRHIISKLQSKPLNPKRKK